MLITSLLFTFVKKALKRDIFKAVNLGALKPTGKNILISRNQTSGEIAGAIVKAIEESKASAQEIAPYLKGSTKRQTAKNIWLFTKKVIPYRKESENYQTAKTLPRILGDINTTGGDCKHYSIAIASLLKASEIPCKLRLVSQRMFSSSPNHIYVVALINGEEFVLDCCLKQFDTECSYYKKYDIKVK